MNPIIQNIEAGIKSHGQGLIGVMPTEGENFQPFYYTVGMKQYGFPDLLCIGAFPSHTIAMMLNAMCAMTRKKEKSFEEGLNDIEWSIPVKVRKCGERAKAEYSIQAGQYYDTEEYEILQVMLCDKEGRYQDAEDCEYGKVDMP